MIKDANEQTQYNVDKDEDKQDEINSAECWNTNRHRVITKWLKGIKNLIAIE